MPSASTAAFSGELADSYVESAQLASGLGYKVVIITMNESRSEAKSEVFFSLRGRQLNDTNEKRVRKRNKCFQFVFPVDFIMPDNSSITLNSKEEWVLIKEWYTLHLDVTDKPALVFPVDITLEDGTVQTLLDREELAVIKDSCKRGKDKRKCFKLILPVSFTMPDASEIQVNERADFRLVRAWHKANPDATEKGNLNFPVDIEFKDGTLETVNDEVAYIAAKESCTD